MAEIKPQPGDPDWEDPREYLPGPELIRAAEQAIRRAYTIGIPASPDQEFWQAIAGYLNDTSHVPELTGTRPRDNREFNRACRMAYSVLAILNARRVSRADVLAGRLPADAWGVRWTDIGRTDCRPHLTGSMVRLADGELDAPVGFVLTGPLVCDICRRGGRS
jgi:hypothetical protein